MARLLLCMLEVNALETASEATLHFPFYKSRQSGLIENRLALKPAVKNKKEHHRGCAWLAIHTARSMQSIFLTVVRRVLNMYVVQSVFLYGKQTPSLHRRFLLLARIALAFMIYAIEWCVVCVNRRL